MNYVAGDVFSIPFFMAGSVADDDVRESIPAVGRSFPGFHGDQGNTGKDDGHGFISNGQVGYISKNPLDQGQYEVPIKVNITLV